MLASDGISIDRLCAEPYRLYFPLGIFATVIGVGLWPIYYLFPALSYPSREHASVQMLSAMQFFVFGFLLTMLPKLLSLQPLTRFFFAAFPIILLAQLTAGLWGSQLVVQDLMLLLFSCFFSFIALRIGQRAINPPPSFLLIAAAMLGGVLSAAISMLAEVFGANSFSPSIIAAAKSFQLAGYLHLLVLGVGSFLLPKLFAQHTVDPASLRSSFPAYQTFHFVRYGSAAMLVATAAVCEGMALTTGQLQFLQVSGAMRLAASLLCFLPGVPLFRLPGKQPMYLVLAWIALWGLCLGFAALIWRPEYYIAWKHLVFIVGYCGLIISIGTRVIVSHGGQSCNIPNRARLLTLGAVIGLLLLSASARISTDIWTALHREHLAIASGFLLIALFIWTWHFGKLLCTYPAASTAAHGIDNC